MSKSIIPHYSELNKILDTNQILIYKKIYNETIHKLPIGYKVFSKLKGLNSKFFKKKPLEVLKCSENNVVLVNKNKVYKLLFKNCNDFKTEVYFSHLFYREEVKSYSIYKGCIMVLPKYGPSLYDIISENIKIDIEKLRKCLIRQIINFHCLNIVHHDIKPSNIVKNTSSIGDKWKIIDYGLSFPMNGFYSNQLSFNRGTKKYNVPNFVDEIEFDDRIFFLYMKDWYGLSKTLQDLNYNCDIAILIDSMNIDHIRKKIRSIVLENNEGVPNYLIN